jgi:hypothetical protein
MNLKNITYQGPQIDDEEILSLIPPELSTLLNEVNGFILACGILHVRGACKNPSWHSLRNIMQGTGALHKLFPCVEEADIPFGEDCVGDQFLCRKGLIHRLASETGELKKLDLSLQDFMDIAEKDPVKILSPEPLYQFEAEGNILQPGQLLSVFPPYCIKTSEEKVSLKAVSSEERINFLAEFARQIRNIPDGTKIRFSITD